MRNSEAADPYDELQSQDVAQKADSIAHVIERREDVSYKYGPVEPPITLQVLYVGPYAVEEVILQRAKTWELALARRYGMNISLTIARDAIQNG